MSCICHHARVVHVQDRYKDQWPLVSWRFLSAKSSPVLCTLNSSVVMYHYRILSVICIVNFLFYLPFLPFTRVFFFQLPAFSLMSSSIKVLNVLSTFTLNSFWYVFFVTWQYYYEWGNQIIYSEYVTDSCSRSLVSYIWGTITEN